VRQYRFGDFHLDLEGGFLLGGGEEVALRAKSFEVLTYLVERQGQLVAKTELIDAVWRDAAVTDNSLAQCLVEIRRALDDRCAGVGPHRIPARLSVCSAGHDGPLGISAQLR
jgi:DNA-binding winged helix-turn-helix (wHTH) protein